MGNAGGRGSKRQRGIKRSKKWDNCNRITNKLHLKKKKKKNKVGTGRNIVLLLKQKWIVDLGHTVPSGQSFGAWGVFLSLGSLPQWAAWQQGKVLTTSMWKAMDING